jgi:hypothetical protein
VGFRTNPNLILKESHRHIKTAPTPPPIKPPPTDPGRNNPRGIQTAPIRKAIRGWIFGGRWRNPGSGG